MSKDPSQDHLFTSMIYYCKSVRGMNIAEVRITRRIKHQLKIFNQSMNAMIVIELPACCYSWRYSWRYSCCYSWRYCKVRVLENIFIVSKQYENSACRYHNFSWMNSYIFGHLIFIQYTSLRNVIKATPLWLIAHTFICICLVFFI